MMRINPTSSRVHSVLAMAITVAGLGAVLVAGGADLRQMSAALGVAVFGLLTWRTVATWPVLSDLERVLAVALATSPLLAAIAQQYAVHANQTLADNPWLWALVAHRIGCILIVALWSHLLGRRHRRAGGRPVARLTSDDVPWAA